MAIQANTVGGPLDDIYKDLKLLPTEVLKSYLQNPNNMQADGVSFSLMAGGVLADRARQQAAFAASQQPNPAQIPTVAQTLAQGQPVGVGGVPAGGAGAGIAAFAQQAQQGQQPQSQQITLNPAKQATPAPSIVSQYAAAKTPLQQQVSGPPTPTRKMAQGGIVALSGGGTPGANDTEDKKQAFIQQVMPAAKQAAATLNVPVEAIIGQWALETGWGKSVIPGTFNLGNIKAQPGYAGRTVSAIDNQTGRTDPYRAYGSFAEAGSDFTKLLQTPRYSAVKGAATPEAFFEAAKKAGYVGNENSNYVSSGVATTDSVKRALAAREAQGNPLSSELDLQAPASSFLSGRAKPSLKASVAAPAAPPTPFSDPRRTNIDTRSQDEQRDAGMAAAYAEPPTASPVAPEVNPLQNWAVKTLTSDARQKQLAKSTDELMAVIQGMKPQQLTETEEEAYKQKQVDKTRAISKPFFDQAQALVAQQAPRESDATSRALIAGGLSMIGNRGNFRQALGEGGLKALSAFDSAKQLEDAEKRKYIEAQMSLLNAQRLDELGHHKEAQQALAQRDRVLKDAQDFGLRKAQALISVQQPAAQQEQQDQGIARQMLGQFSAEKIAAAKQAAAEEKAKRLTPEELLKFRKEVEESWPNEMGKYLRPDIIAAIRKGGDMLKDQAVVNAVEQGKRQFFNDLLSQTSKTVRPPSADALLNAATRG